MKISKSFKISDLFRVYVDGACEPNPGDGGYSAIIFRGDDMNPRIIITGGQKDTTNNRMEIMGVLATLRYLNKPSKINIFSDSQYVCNSINIWLAGWKRRNKVMKNMDLWDEVYSLMKKHTLRATWIKGHCGNFYNEFADGLAMEACAKITDSKKNCFENIRDVMISH